jgi:hypothetical protein
MMADVTYTTDRGGRDIVFTVGGRRYRAGAATARCFRDIESQFSRDAALATVAAAIPLQERVRRRWPSARGPALRAGEAEVLGEALLLAGGVSEGAAERLCRMNDGYRNNPSASFPLRDYGFRPPVSAPGTDDSPGLASVAPQPSRRSDVHYWRVGTRSTEEHESWWDDMREGSFIAIVWPRLGDLSEIVHDPAELRRRIRQHYPQRDPDNIQRAIVNFLFGMQEGDIVVAAAGMTNLAIGRVIGPYEHNPARAPNTPDHRRVDWLEIAPWRAPVPSGKELPEGFRRTLTRLQHPETIEAIERRLSAGPIRPGIRYIWADESPSTAAPEPFGRDADALDRASRAHAVTQNLLARFLIDRGLEPRSGDSTFQFDLAWRAGSRTCVAEVKSLPAASEEQQLRLGLGQVLRYAHALSGRGAQEQVCPVLMVERQPSDPAWGEVCSGVGVVLVWPERLEAELTGRGLA